MKTTNPTIETILQRRTIRSLKSIEIPNEHLQLMLECMQSAPNAGNVEPWFFLVIKNQEIKIQLCKASFDQKVVQDAGVLFVICAEPAVSELKYGEIGKTLFCIQDTSAAVQNLLIASQSLGYSTVWIGTVKQKEISDILSLSESLVPVAIVAVGESNCELPLKQRKPLNQVFKIIE